MKSPSSRPGKRPRADSPEDPHASAASGAPAAPASGTKSRARRDGPAGRAGKLWSRPLAIAAIVGALALLAHAPAVRNAFAYDDHDEIEKNQVLREPFSLRTLFLSEYWGGSSATGWYRPVPLLLQKLTFDAYGVDPVPYHLLVLLAHVATAFLLAWVVAGRFGLPRGALAAGSLFAVHTVHAEAVGAAYGLKEVLAALFSILALAILTGWTERAPRERLVRVLAAAGCVAAAILSKESAAPIPAALIAADLFRGAPFATWREALRRNGRATLLHGGLWAAAAFGAISMRFPAVGGLLLRTPYDAFTNPAAALDPLSRLMMGLRVAAIYGRMLVWPIPFSPTYAQGAVPVPASLLRPDLLAGVALLALLAFALVHSPRFREPAGIGAFWAASTYFLASNLVLAFTTLMSERFLYLPSIGLALLLAPAADRLLAATGETATTPRLRTAAIAAFGVALAALGVLTWVRTPVYGDDREMMRAAYHWYPGGVLARLAHADALVDEGNYDEGLREAEALRADHPGLPIVDQSLATGELARGDRTAARAAFERAIAHPTATVSEHLAYAELLLGEGDPAGALRILNAGFRTGQGNYRDRARARELRGTLLLNAGRTTQATADLRLACAIDPDMISAWEDLASALHRTGDTAGAEGALRTALARSPDRASTLSRLSRLLMGQRRGAEAVPLLQRLAELDPRNPGVHTDLGTACVQASRVDEASRAFETALSLDPRQMVALATLGSIRERQMRPEEARRLYETYLAYGPKDDPLTAGVRERLARLH